VISVRKETSARGGRYVASVAGVEGEAELVFSNRSPGVISADHTGAPDSLRGTGAAAALVQTMVDDARSQGFRIIPICPYVLSQHRKHPDWKDVISTGP
jgi:predicted GNAT family acetyltransferase